MEAVQSVLRHPSFHLQLQMKQHQPSGFLPRLGHLRLPILLHTSTVSLYKAAPPLFGQRQTYSRRLLSKIQELNDGGKIAKMYVRSCAKTLHDDEEWHKQRHKESEELKRLRQREEQEEEQKTKEYRKITMQLRGINEEEIRRAKRLVATLIKSGEEIEEKIEEAADNGELTKLILLVIRNRLEVARRDDERHAMQALDLLYRRIEAEMMKRMSSSALQLLNELLNLHDGFNHDEWIRRCRQRMLKIFPAEDAFTILAPPGIDLTSQKGPIEMPEEDNILLRVDFIREVDSLLAELETQPKKSTPNALDPQSVALRLQLQQREKTLQQVIDLRNLAAKLKW